MKNKLIFAASIALAAAPLPAAALPAVPSAAAPADALDPAKLAVAREIVAVVLPEDQREKMFNSVLDSMMRSMVTGTMQGLGLEDDIKNDPKLREVFTNFMARQRMLAMNDIRAAIPGLVEAYAHAYARMFSLDDLTAIRAFVLTPAGAHFVQRGPEMLADPDVAAWQQKLAAQGASRQSSELERFRTELMTIRPRKPGSTSS